MHALDVRRGRNALWAPVALAAVTVAIGVACLLADTGLGVDSSVYRAGALAVLKAEPLYEHLTELPEWAPELPFTYPPFAALVFLPLSVLPTQLAWCVPAVASAFGLAATLRAFGPARLLLPLLALSLCLEPVWRGLGLGQVNVVLMAIVVVDVLVLKGSRRSGVLIGIAAAVKLTPLIFIVHLWLTGRRTDAVRAVATFAGLTALGAVVLPGDSVRYWTSAVFGEHMESWKAWFGNQSLHGVLTRLGDGAGWSVVAFVLVAGFCAAVTALLVRRLHASGDAAGALLVTACCGLLVSPISWTHHWVWVVALAGYLAGAGYRFLLAGVVAVFCGAALASVPGGGGVEHHWNAVEFVFGNAYTFVTVAGLVLAWRSSRGVVRPRARPELGVGGALRSPRD